MVHATVENDPDVQMVWKGLNFARSQRDRFARRAAVPIGLLLLFNLLILRFPEATLFSATRTMYSAASHYLFSMDYGFGSF